MNRSRFSPVAAPMESLETRRMFASLTVNGTAGNDVITVTSDPIYVYITVNGESTRAKAVRDFIISGGTGNDNITVDQSLTVDGIISGNSGNDTIYGGGGDDLITGNNGNDLIYGYNGNDILCGNDGSDTLYGGDGFDSVYANDGANNPDGDQDWLFEFYTDPGRDTLYFTVAEDVVKNSV